MRLIALMTLIMMIGLAYAEKPEWAGKGKPTDEQKAAHRAAMEAKSDEMDDDAGEIRGQAEKKMKTAKTEREAKAVKLKNSSESGREAAMVKQREMKAEQVRKSADKGSDKGQAQRQERSRAWWKFWGD